MRSGAYAMPVTIACRFDETCKARPNAEARKANTMDGARSAWPRMAGPAPSTKDGCLPAALRKSWDPSNGIL